MTLQEAIHNEHLFSLMVEHFASIAESIWGKEALTKSAAVNSATHDRLEEKHGRRTPLEVVLQHGMSLNERELRKVLCMSWEVRRNHNTERALDNVPTL